MPLTYEPIATTTLGSDSQPITFSSIPSTYTDLRLVLLVKKNATTATNVNLQFNGDTATNYSGTQLSGDGASASSSRLSNYNWMPIWGFAVTTAGDIALITADIFSYAGSNYKTVLSTGSLDRNGSGSVTQNAGLWRSVAAVTSITLLDTSSRTFGAGTTATLYGIKKA